MTRAMGSEYMEWAKTRSAARFNLASSGVAAFPLAELGARIEDLVLVRSDGTLENLTPAPYELEIEPRA
mgnify:CR=1 FL=1